MKGVCGFLGLTTIFVKNYEKIAKPLTGLIKDNFSWGQPTSNAFNQLK